MSVAVGIRNFGAKLKVSAVNLYRAVPRDRKTFMSLHRQKVGFIKEAGIRQVAREWLRTAINLIIAGRASYSKEVKKTFISAPPWDITDIYRSYPFFKYIPDTLAMEIARYFPPNYQPLTLVDKKYGYTCYQLPINEDNREKVEAARTLVAGSLLKYGYEGWSNEIDRRNDPHAFYFIVEDDQGEIVATSRMIHRITDNTIPLEQGLKEDGTSYSLHEETRNVVDINSFYNKKGHTRALFPLFAAMGRHAWLTGAQRVYCMLDEDNEYITKLYLKARFKFSEQFSEKIYFQTFGRTSEREFQPTFWTIMEMRRFWIFFHGLRANKYKAV